MLSFGLKCVFVAPLIALLLGSVEGCSFVYTKSGVIAASAQYLSNISMMTSATKSEYTCTYFVTSTDSSETITLELTMVNGFSETLHVPMKCSPRLDIFAVGSSGKENRVARLCRDDDVKLPKVFRISTNLAKIVFSWPSEKRTAEFKMNFIFSGTSSITVLLVVAVLGSTLIVLLFCGIVAYRILVRHVSPSSVSGCGLHNCCSNRGVSDLLSQSDDDALHHAQSKKIAACDFSECGHHCVTSLGAHGKRQLLLTSSQPAQHPHPQQQALDNLRFPHPVPRTLDGEDGSYWACQKHLRRDCGTAESNYVDLYRAPPNKTVADCQSPNHTSDPRAGDVV